MINRDWHYEQKARFLDYKIRKEFIELMWRGWKLEDACKYLGISWDMGKGILSMNTNENMILNRVSI